MKKITGIFVTSTAIAVMLAAWIIVICSKTMTEKQLELLDEATKLTDNGIYILAVPLLEEAAGYNTKYTEIAEEKLKSVYLELLDNRGYTKKYTDLIDRQMAREDAKAEVYLEAAEYYIKANDMQNALNVLRTGIEKTGDAMLETLYESSRYSYTFNRFVYEDITEICGQSVQVMQESKWGIADIDGKVIIPCRYDKISTLWQDCAIVQADGQIFAVDASGNKIAAAGNGITDFKNYADNRTAVLSDGGWYRATGKFETGTSVFEDFGMYSGGYAAAKTGGRWGVIDIADKWLIPAEYDEVITDNPGRCYGQGCVFVRNGNTVYLFSAGKFTEKTYQDAKPFTDDGYAAVMQNGKWGYIDTQGNIMIDFIFDDAQSFRGHLAAVEIGGLWGYLSIYGQVVIEPVFKQARAFVMGSAPVLTDKGWQIITLTEYKKERRLI